MFSCSIEKRVTSRKIIDNHVHIMSPELISLWKNMGIPFSRPDYYYSNIDSILKFNKAEKVSLISMAYVYSSPEFGAKSDKVKSQMEAENNYLASVKNKYPKRIKAFFSVDPLQENMLEEIIRCHKILKLDCIKLHHNASQVYLTENEHLHKIQQIFKYASDNRLPILLHFDNSHPKFGKNDIKIFANSVLNNLDYVNLQIAHFGTSGGFNSKTKEILDTFIEVFKTNNKVANQNIKFDISAVCLDKDSEGVNKLTDSEFKELANYCRKIGFEKIVFGTDYPLYNSDEYLEILMNKLQLSEAEINLLLKDKE